MLLGTDSIRLSKPGTELRIDLRRRLNAEVVDVIAWRNGVDTAKAWMRKTAGKHDMAVEPALTRRHLCK